MNWEVVWTVIAIVGFVAAGAVALGLILWTVFLLLARRAVKSATRVSWPPFGENLQSIRSGKLAWA